jgi:Cys-tRNA(Pro)/Cys-tRNA(Cys) deacylase
MAKDKTPRGKGTPATLALLDAGIPFSSHTYEHNPSTTSYGVEAAQALGLSPAEVFKTLIVLVDAQPHVAVISVDCTLNMKMLAQAAGGKRAEMAPTETAQRLTGYVLGGISPIGQRTQLPTVIDDSVLGLERVYISGGARGFDIGLSPEDLLQITSAIVAQIAVGRASPPAPTV